MILAHRISHLLRDAGAGYDSGLKLRTALCSRSRQAVPSRGINLWLQPLGSSTMLRETTIEPSIDIESGAPETTASAVSWGAILAGGVAAASLTLILLAFGAGVGFSSISPWSTTATTTTFHIAAGLYFIVTAMIASGVGGYLPRRLRARGVLPRYRAWLPGLGLCHVAERRRAGLGRQCPGGRRNVGGHARRRPVCRTAGRLCRLSGAR